MNSGHGAAGDGCPDCGGPLMERPEFPYPSGVQAAFGVSFVLFLALFNRVQQSRPAIWAWSALQIALGILLIRRRIRAKSRVLRCIRCEHALR